MDEQEQTIDLRNLLVIFKEHIILLIAVALACGVASFCISAFLIEKQYTSSALLYVENSAHKSDDSAINLNDINAAQKLVTTCQILFTSDYMLSRLSAELPELPYSAVAYGNMISVESVNSTEVLKISVVTNSPDESKKIADKLVELSQEEYLRVIKNGSIEVVSDATYPTSHTYPSNTRFAVIGFLAGFFGLYFIFVVIEIFDKKVKPDDDLGKMYDIPVFAEIMDFLSVSKTDSKYGYGAKRSKKRGEGEIADGDIDDDLNFDEEEEQEEEDF